MATGMVSWDLRSQWTQQATRQPSGSQSSASTESTQNTGESHSTGEISPPLNVHCRNRRIQQVQENNYHDLRQTHLPEDPDILEMQYYHLLQKPKSPPMQQICKFQPVNTIDTKTKRWEWWAALSKTSDLCP